MSKITFWLMSFSFLMFVLGVILLVLAFVIYLPMLCCVIRGNLKEFVCHKIDKRISELLRRKSRKRIIEEQRQQALLQRELAKAQQGMGDSKTANDIMMKTIPQPTLPKFDDIDEVTNVRSPYVNHQAPKTSFESGQSMRPLMQSNQAYPPQHYSQGPQNTVNPPPYAGQPENVYPAIGYNANPVPNPHRSPPQPPQERQRPPRSNDPSNGSGSRYYYD